MIYIISLIFIIIFIIFLVIIFKIKKFINNKINSINSIVNLVGSNLILDESDNGPKSLPNLEKIYLKDINKDFDNLDIDILKNKIIEEFSKILNNEKVKTNEKVRKQINKKYTHIKDINIHDIVICSYDKFNSIIGFALSFSYNKDDSKIEDKIILEYKLNNTKDYKSNCLNCGAPVENNKICKYCNTPLNINQYWELYKIR